MPSGEAGKPGEKSQSQALLVLKETKDLLVRLDPRDLKAPKERGSKTAMDQVE